MAIVIEAVTVVVRNTTLAAKYPGGVEGFRRDCPNGTYCADEHLSSVSFMSPGDSEVFIAGLAAKGLTPALIGRAEDVAAATPACVLVPCEWLSFAYWDDIPCAWQTGADRGSLHAPEGWTPERRVRHMSEAEIAERLEFVRSDGNIDVYRDKTSGQECYVGRTAAVSEEDAERAQTLYDQAVGLVRDLIVPDLQAAPPLDVTDKYACQHAIPLLTEVTQLFPLNWQSMWLLGKIHQRLGDNEQGLEWFSRAHRVAPGQPDAAREAAISCMEMGRPAEAVGYCERAIEANPRDAGLRANMALALLFSERPQDAKNAIHESLSLNPNDQVSARIGELVDDVIAGTRPCPKHIRDLE